MNNYSTSSERFIHTNFLARQRVRRSRGESRKLPFGIICMGLSVLVCFFVFLWVRIYVLEIGYRISSAHEANSELLQKNRRLRIERASLRAPSRIEDIAKNRLGMVVPRNSQVVSLKW